MNSYDDYYNYLNAGYADMNYMTNPNSMIGDLNYQSLMPAIDSNKGTNILDSFVGFKKGNMFGNLYDSYRNYKPADLKAGSEREDMLMQLQELNFAMIDLGLYLDLYDNDRKAINLFNEYQRKEKELSRMVENKYGPLTFDSMQIANTWTWDNGPWPWEVQR